MCQKRNILSQFNAPTVTTILGFAVFLVKWDTGLQIKLQLYTHKSAKYGRSLKKVFLILFREFLAKFLRLKINTL